VLGYVEEHKKQAKQKTQRKEEKVQWKF